MAFPHGGSSFSQLCQKCTLPGGPVNSQQPQIHVHLLLLATSWLSVWLLALYKGIEQVTKTDDMVYYTQTQGVNVASQKPHKKVCIMTLI